jgi:hypothetical protein
MPHVYNFPLPRHEACMQSHDVLDRRNRYLATSTGKRVTLKPRDLRWLEALRDHGPLPSHYLHAFTDDTHSSAKASRIRLADLAHEDNTPHGGCYLRRPMAQRSAFSALNQPLVYDLTEAGWEALGMKPALCQRPTGPFAHQLMVSTVTASIELRAIRASGLRYIPGWQILARSNARMSADVRVTVPPEQRERVHQLQPDQLFGLEYAPRSGVKRYRSFLVECDRSTEPITSTNTARKSYRRSYLQYRHFVGDGLYKEHFRLKSTLLVLNVMSDRSRMSAFMQLIDRHAPEGNSFMLFKCLDRETSLVPPLLVDEMAESWNRVGLEVVTPFEL